MKYRVPVNKRLIRNASVIVCTTLIYGCANFNQMSDYKYAETRTTATANSVTLVEGVNQPLSKQKNGSFVKVSRETIRTAPLLQASQGGESAQTDAITLPDTPVSLNADGLELNHFINLALGDVLKVNYVVDSDLAKNKTPITLRINEPVPAERLLGLVEEVLMVNKVSLAIDGDLIKVIPASKTDNAVPTLIDTSIAPVLRYGKVVEIIPVYYLSIIEASSLASNLLREQGGGKVLRQMNLNALMVIASKEDIDRIYTLLREIDVPNRVSENISLVSPKYVSLDNLISDLQLSLNAASVPVAIGAGQNGVVLVPLSNNTLMITASTKGWMSYTLEWIKQLDQPKQINGNQGIYAYYMQNTKAEDAWGVVSAIFSEQMNSDKEEQSSSKGTDLVAAAQQAIQNKQNSSLENLPGNQGISKPTTGSSKKSMQVVTENYRVVVDSQRNSIFFTGEYADYQRLVELLKFVDKRPRQVLIQATIAEINVDDAQELGFDFNVTGGDITGGTKGLAEIQNKVLTLTGVFGDVTLGFQAALKTGKAQVLSSPRIIAMNQEPARITVGDQIQVITGEVSGGGDDSKATTTYTYVDTGVTLDIIPTINQNGLVELEISQEVSNKGTGTDINRRSLQTKLLADSGDTVFMGGLIKQDVGETDNRVPLLGDIPYVGNLFKYKSQTQKSVELVLLITPYVINSREDAIFYTNEFQELTGWELSQYKPN
ncbi:secretin N-terminal domain-containing protein [Vibrio rotiferianus]|uniref:secretin N-terminal domain-containing protein n=1 Tax=Vibrio rotiferianus TaxID=190895 RepID=UPI0002376717|nr:secretin N-terminal domain-containing protein [Vibrio rotiferianus]